MPEPEPEHPKLDIPKINVNVLNDELSKTEKPKPALEDSDKLLIGKVIVALMEQFKDLLISSKDDGSIKIEQMEGNICQFSVENHKIQLSDPNILETPLQYVFRQLNFASLLC